MKHNKPSLLAVSVVIPCYNQGEFLAEAIQSVEQCPKELYEIIIVNDGSDDPQTLKVLDAFRESYKILDQQNCGLPAARNRAIGEAMGRYILPLDADNKIRPQYMTRAIEILDKSPSVGVVYSDCQKFGLKKSIRTKLEFDINRLLIANYIDACAVFRKTVWEQCGGYDTKLNGWQDWEFWINAFVQGWQFCYIPEVLYDYRVRTDSMQMKSRAMAGDLYRYIYGKHYGLIRKGLQRAYYYSQPKYKRVFNVLKKYFLKRLAAQKSGREALRGK